MAFLTVGAGKQYATIAAAVAAAKDGDTLDVDAGTYTNDYASISKNITLQGVGGTVHLVSTGLIPNGKGIFVVTGNITVNNFEFSGAQVADHNGAGIRMTSGNLVLNDCYFHDNENGVLTGNTTTDTLTINNSEFAHNGYGDGQTHNLYAGNIGSLTINNSYFHDAIVGHEIKSRALSSTITNSRVYDLNGTASLSIDLPNGGNAVIQNNVIEQGPNSPNSKIINYGEEGNLNPGTNFVISGNTILNDKSGYPLALWNATTTVTAQLANNKFFGLTSSQIASGPNTQTGNQFLTAEPALDTTSPWSAPIGLSIGLALDTGSSSTDNITTNPAVKGTGQANTAVTLKEGGTTLGSTTTDSTGAWSFTPTGLADGKHTLSVIQTDLAGNTWTEMQSFTLDRTAPVMSIALSLDTGSSATDKITSNPAIKGTGDPSRVVTIKQGTTVLGTATSGSTGAWSFTPTGFTDGLHTLTATETDLAGNTGATTFSFTLDKTAPVVSMALSSDTGSSATDKITSNPAIKGTGQANTVVTVKEGTTVLGTTTAGSTGAWSFTPTGLASAAHTLTATQTDLAGNTGTTAFSFMLDTTAPTVSMALTSDTGSSATDGITSNPAITGTGQANTVVTVKEGSTTLGTATASSTGVWSFTPPGLADGTHTLTATQTDLAGNTGAAALTFTLDRTAPTVSMALTSDTGTSSTDGITSNPAVNGTAEANTMVTLQEGTAILGTTMADIAGAWSFTPTGLADGKHTLTATDADLAGNTGSISLTFTLDTLNATGVA